MLSKQNSGYKSVSFSGVKKEKIEADSTCASEIKDGDYEIQRSNSKQNSFKNDLLNTPQSQQSLPFHQKAQSKETIPFFCTAPSTPFRTPNSMSMPSSPSTTYFSARSSLSRIDLSRVSKELELLNNFSFVIDSQWKNKDDNILVSDELSIFPHNLNNAIEQSKVKWANIFKDSLFPANQYSISPIQSPLSKAIKWVSIKQLFGEGVPFTVGESVDYKSTSTINWQHNYLIDIIGCVASQPERITKLFKDNQDNLISKNCYIVRLNFRGIWQYTLMDDLIPVLGDELQPVFCRIEDNFWRQQIKSGGKVDIWIYLLEKGLAHYYSSYEKLALGYVRDILFDLTGSPVEEIHLNINTTSKSFLFKTISQAFEQNNLVMLRVQNEDKRVERLSPICKITQIHRIPQKDKLSSLLVFEVEKMRDQKYFQSCIHLQSIADDLPKEFLEYMKQQEKSKLFISFEDTLNLFNTIVITRIFDNYFTYSTKVRQTKSSSCAIFKLYLQQPSKFYLILSQFDQRRMGNGYFYKPLRLVLAKYSSENDVSTSVIPEFRGGFVGEKRDSFGEFHCEAGEYVVIVTQELPEGAYHISSSHKNQENISKGKLHNPSSDQQKIIDDYSSNNTNANHDVKFLIFDSTLTYYGESKAVLVEEEGEEEKNNSILGDILGQQAKHTFKQIYRDRKIQKQKQSNEPSNPKSENNSKRIETSTLIYNPSKNVVQFDKIQYFDKNIGMIIEIYKNKALVSLKLSKNQKQINKQGLQLIGQELKSNLKQFNVPSGQDLVLVYSILNFHRLLSANKQVEIKQQNKSKQFISQLSLFQRDFMSTTDGTKDLYDQ